MDFIYCLTCKHHSKSWRNRDKISKGMQLLSRLRQDYLVLHSKTQGHVLSTEEAAASTVLAPANASANKKTTFESREQEILALWKDCLSDVSVVGSQNATLFQSQLADRMNRKFVLARTTKSIADAQSLLAKMQAGLNEVAQKVSTSKSADQVQKTEVF